MYHFNHNLWWTKSNINYLAPLLKWKKSFDDNTITKAYIIQETNFINNKLAIDTVNLPNNDNVVLTTNADGTSKLKELAPDILGDYCIFYRYELLYIII